MDYTKLAGTAGYLPEFAAAAFKVLTDPASGAKVGFPFCWGAYGITDDAAVVAREAPRPDGKRFNPYVLTDDELAEVEKLLIQQKGLRPIRYQDNPTLFQLLQSGAVVVATEFAQVYRQLLTATDGMTKGDFRHTL